MRRLARFLDGFAECFVHHAHSGHAKRYSQGLLSDAKAKNMEGLLSRLAEPGDYQSFQHFMTHSTWAADRAWERLVEILPEREGFLLIDDTSLQYRDLKQEVALDHFEGRSYPGLARHLVLTALAYCFLLLERRRSRAAALPSLNAVRRSVTEIVVAILFATGEHFAKMVADTEFARDPPQI